METDAAYNALTVKGNTTKLSPEQMTILKEMVTGALRVAIRQEDQQLIREFGEILKAFI